jgi:hypothetical protein
MRSPEQEVQVAGEVRGQLFTDLDRLAFALEMEGVERLAAGDREAALRLENQRLGVRLAQRMVADVWADEVNLRIRRWQAEYAARLEPGEKVEAR